MSYYSDFFFRPKQAIAFAYEHPSISRSLAFVILGTLAGVLAGLLFAGALFTDMLIRTLLADLVRWIAGGILFVLLGALVKKIPLNGRSFSQALSVLAHINVYGFFLFLVLGILLPAVAIPDLIQASQQYNQGNIGDAEFQTALADSLSGASTNFLLALPIILFAFLLVLYSIYALYLSAIKFFDTTAFKAILVSILWILGQSLLVFGLNSVLD